MKLHIHYISGISADRIEVTSDDSSIKETYTFGRNCTYKRENATKEAPYIGDLLADLVETNYINTKDIIYSGYNVFAGCPLTESEVDKYFTSILSEI